MQGKFAVLSAVKRLEVMEGLLHGDGKVSLFHRVMASWIASCCLMFCFCTSSSSSVEFDDHVIAQTTNNNREKLFRTTLHRNSELCGHRQFPMPMPIVLCESKR